ncbi:MAG: ABC transporter ATP-binding protein [bacterium]
MQRRNDAEPAAVTLNRVSKAYSKYTEPLDRLKDLLRPGRARAALFWALRDVSLEVPRGHTVGIVGRNGSGKSTLLQLVAGTLTASAGEVSVNGRLAALLELGSGFNPEFTGRENAIFQATLQGLRGDELETSLESAARFADIGDFLDRPVRTYSSGMFVRLAFAVAISTAPDVLIVDEALSVGDEAFQRKCFARIREIQERGGTILFVSHSASAVVELCDWAVLLDGGERLLAGPPKEIVAHYHKLLFAPAARQAEIREQIRSAARDGAAARGSPSGDPPPEMPGEELGDRFDPGLVSASSLSYVPRGAEILDPEVRTLSGLRVNVLTRRREYLYTYRVRFSAPAFQVRFGMLIKTLTGFELGGAVSHAPAQGLDHVEPGQIAEIVFRFKALLTPGVYFLNAGVVGIVDGEEVFLHRYIDAFAFRIQPEVDLTATGNVDFLVEPEVGIAAAASAAGVRVLAAE